MSYRIAAIGGDGIGPEVLAEGLGTRRDDAAATAAARRIERAVTTVLARGRPRTVDIGGAATTGEVGDAVAAAL